MFIRRYLKFFFVVLILSTIVFAGAYIQNYLSANVYLGKEQERFWVWAKQAGGQGWTYGSSNAVDEQGNVYVAGFLSGTIGFLGVSAGTSNFDGQILTHRSEMDMFVVKYRSNGSIAWIKQIGDTGGSNAKSISISKDGNLYITGTIRDSILEPGAGGSARIGAFTLSNYGGKDMFILCLNQAGDPLWVTQSGSSGEVQGEAIAVDNAGNSYVTGTFNGRFGNTDVISTGKEGIFIAKYNKTGHLVWVRGVGGPAENEGIDIAVDRDGNCYVTGFWGKELISSDTLEIPSRVQNFFLAKHDSNGVLRWIRHGSGNSRNSRAYAIAVDGERNSYITGGFQGELVFGSTILNSVSSTNDPVQYDDIFVAKYDPNGLPIWAKQGGGVKGDMGQDIAVDKAGNCYVTGSFWGNATFGTIRLTGKTTDPGDRPVFVAKYDSLGTLIWVEQSTGSGPQSSSGNGIALNTQGDCYITGFFDNAIQFGSIKLEGFNSRNMFVAKINPK